MRGAYEVFMALEQALGRPLTYEEVLALVAHHEFGWARSEGTMNEEQYNVALEAMGRQFYNFCGSEGVCEGDELWKFLGAQQAWYDKNGAALAQELKNGVIPEFNFAGAQRVLNQPAYDPNNTTVEEMRLNWRSAANVSGVPFVYGNYNMYADDGYSFADLRSRAPDGTINGNALNTSYLNLPHMNGSNGNGYMVVTIGQHECLIHTGPCK